MRFSYWGGHSAQVKAAPKLNKKSVSITVGKTVKLSVKGTKKKVKWSSTNSAVASVGKTGRVTGKSAGKATIKAKTGSKTLKCSVKVIAKKEGSSDNKPDPVSDTNPVAPTGLTITGPSAILAPGGTMQLSVGYLPANAEKWAVQWKSELPYMIEVSDTGLVTAKREGTFTITARLASNWYIKAEYLITVKDFGRGISYDAKDGGDVILSDAGAAMIFGAWWGITVPDAKIQVADSAGSVIRTWTIGTAAGEITKTVEWDLKDENGNKVLPGSYCLWTFAAGRIDKWEGNFFKIYADSEFGNGNGSESKPYEVSTLDHLYRMVDHNGRYFKQTADIDVSGKDVFPIFTADTPFTGTYDGGGYAIKNASMIMNEGENVGIFRSVGEKGSLKNVTVEGGSFIGKNNIAALAGSNAGTLENCKVNNCGLIANNGDVGAVAAYNKGTIKNCQTSGNEISVQGGNAHGGGGISGYNDGGIITGCTSEGNTIKLPGAGMRAGGIVGTNTRTGTVIDCKSLSSILHSSNATYTDGGGIAGYSEGNITRCTVRELTMNGDWLRKGGIIGTNRGGGNIENSYLGELEREVGGD